MGHLGASVRGGAAGTDRHPIDLRSNKFAGMDHADETKDVGG